MAIARARQFGLHLAVCVSLIWALPCRGQDPLETSPVPSQFKLDMQMAARLRPQLEAESVELSGPHATGQLVFDRLVEQLSAKSSPPFRWQVRMVEDDGLNAFSSPDGGVFIEGGLARVAGRSAGLWAAILSHEIAHVVRRDWARRYLFQKHLAAGGGEIVMGDPGQPSESWSDSEKASADLGSFCRRLELEADRASLMLMARAGYHPDFVPALHHLLHAHESGPGSKSLYAMHPCWEERDRELSRAYLEASIEFAHLWPAWYSSPGGNPPVVVFTDQPTVKKTSAKAWQLQIPMRCQNLAGAVEVVLEARAVSPGEERAVDVVDNSGARQLTGCTSPTTTVVFPFSETSAGSGPQWTDVFVLDAWGAVLARADLPKMPR